MTKILSVPSRLSSTYWSVGPLPLLAPLTLTTVLLPFLTGVAVPFRTCLIAVSLRARRLPSLGLGSSSDPFWAAASAGWVATRATVGWAPTMGAPSATPMPAARARLSSPLDVLRTDPPRLAAVLGRRSARCVWPIRVTRTSGVGLGLPRATREGEWHCGPLRARG